MANIFNFKQGDVITRVELSSTGKPDFIGTPLKFAGIANGSIYALVDPGSSQAMLNIRENVAITLPVSLFTEGWEKYVDPRELFKGMEMITKDGEMKVYGEEEEKQELSVEDQIEAAVKEEDYELASRLRKLVH